MRLIDATDLVRRVLEERDRIMLEAIPRFEFAVANPERYRQAMHGGLRKALRCIEESPAVDAVEVVRCRDCLNCGMKASIKYDGYRDDVRLCMLHGIAILPDDYCSGGVKAEAEVQE